MYRIQREAWQQEIKSHHWAESLHESRLYPGLCLEQQQRKRGVKVVVLEAEE